LARPRRLGHPCSRHPRRSHRHRDLAQDGRAHRVPGPEAAAERGVRCSVPRDRAAAARGLGARRAAARMVASTPPPRTVCAGCRLVAGGWGGIRSGPCGGDRRGARARTGWTVIGRIAIVGAGPAGLTAAIAARGLGLEAVVYEQAPELLRVGGGIAIQNNGQRVLHAVGLLSGFAARMAMAHTIAIEGPGGRRYATLDYGALRVPFPRFAVVLRADLQEHLLLGAVSAGVRVEFGRRCTDVARQGKDVALHFADGSVAESSVVLAADGVHSAVRAGCGFGGMPRAIGEAALRGVVKRPTAGGILREIWLDDGRLFGIAPLSQGRTYFYCSAPRGRWQESMRDVGPWIDEWRAALPEAGEILGAVVDWTCVSY